MPRLSQALIIIALAVAALPLAAPSPARADRPAVTLDLRAVPLSAALTGIQDASGLRLVFAADLMKDAEPVTLSVKDEPVDDVLLKILRPRGMEFIYTAESMAAIVPADTDEGMAKAAGRALRTFARLAQKLEGAVQEGDEVRVPEWEDVDDRALAEAVIDFVSASFYADHYQRISRGLLAAFPKMLNGFDRDMRVGCIVGAVGGDWRLDMNDNGLWLREVMRKMSADADPAVRAVGAFLWHWLRPTLGQGMPVWAMEAGPAMFKAAKDSAPEVRFATALLCGTDRDCPEGPALLARFRGDENAGVRFTSWLFTMEETRLQRDFPEAAGGIFKDRDPIVKVLGILGPCMLYGSGAQEHVDDLIAKKDFADDPWLRTAAELYAPLSRFANARRDDAPAKEDPFAAITRMMDSGKRSQQAVAAASLFIGATIARGQPKPGEPSPDPAAIIKLSESNYPWVRMASVFGCAAIDTPDGWARVLAAVKSRDELDRLAGLMACMSRDPSSTVPLPEALKAAILAALDAPMFPERTLATMAGASMFTFDEILARFQDEARRKPIDDRAFALLLMFRFHRDLTRYNEELRTQRLVAMLDAVLESGNAALQTRFLQQMDWWLGERQPLVLTFIMEAEPQAIYDILTERRNYSPIRDKFPIAELLDRLRALHGSREPSVSLKAVAAFTGCIREASLFNRGREPATSAMALTEAMLADCLKEGAPDDKLACGLELLTMLFSPYTPFKTGGNWDDMTPGVSRALFSALKLASVEQHGRAVAGLLAACHQRKLLQFAKDPQVAAAFEAARRMIMENGKPADQAAMLCGAARDPDKAIAGRAASDLQRLLLMGKVPADLMQEAVNAASHGPAPPELVPMLLERITDKGVDKSLRAMAFFALGQDPAQMPALIDKLEPVARADDEFDMAAGLGSSVYRSLAAIRARKEPEPAWAERAAALGLQIALDPARALKRRSEGISLFAIAAGARSAEKLEAFINDEKLEPELRAAAASVILVDPETKVFASMLGKYETLPGPVRAALAKSACTGKGAGTAGAEAFVVRFLKDDEMEIDSRSSVLNLIELVGAPGMLAALKELENDPRIGGVVRGVIERTAKKAKR